MGIKMGPKIHLLKVLGNLRATDSVIEKENNREFALSSNIITPSSGNYPSAAGRSIERASTSFDVGAIPKFSKYGTVTATLEAKTGGLEILKALRSSKIFEDANRKALVRIVTSELVDYHQNQISFEYDENQVESIKKKYTKAALKKSEVLSSSSQSADYQFTSEEIDKKISLLKFIKPSDENKGKIITCMQETREFRWHWIQSASPTISEVFTTYTRLLDYDGEIIERDFDSKYPNVADNFWKSLPHITFRVLTSLLKIVSQSYTQKQPILLMKLNESDDSPLPVKTAFLNKDLIKSLPDGTNISNYIKEIKEREATNAQPCLILMKGQGYEKFFIEGDNWLMSVGDKSGPIAAFNILYKLFYVLNLQYPNSLQNFFNFIDCYVFGMQGVTSRSVVSALHITLSNITIKDSKVLNDNDNDSLSD
ncbi:hypothetical protein KQX54_013609 [Cotesia glomerata]|uniref:Uncharacterized protein n=1 Tax=Cotesia glomerata TaxID=32391 RepID=A0AAV7IFA9_COTGL|nr:hypothetical protein KQX54_013609 [Cotesia glomerata]